MKFLSLLLSFAISFNVLAASGTVSSLEQHFNELNYVLTVEWDQKDQKFYETQSELFLKKLAELVKKDGLSKEEILSFAEKKMKNKAAFDAMKLKFSLLSPKASEIELMKVLKESSQDFYSQGASWNGEVAVLAIFGGVFAVLIGYAVWFSITHECVEYGQLYRCRDESDCRWIDTDYNGNSYCSSWDTWSECGYERSCVKYEKKK